MSDHATRLLRHVAAHQALAKDAAKPDHLAAGLSIRICVGAMDSDTARVHEIELCEGTGEVLAAILAAHLRTIELSQRLAKLACRDLDAAVATVNTFLKG